MQATAEVLEHGRVGAGMVPAFARPNIEAIRRVPEQDFIDGTA